MAYLIFSNRTPQKSNLFWGSFFGGKNSPKKWGKLPQKQISRGKWGWPFEEYFPHVPTPRMASPSLTIRHTPRSSLRLCTCRKNSFWHIIILNQLPVVQVRCQEEPKQQMFFIVEFRARFDMIRSVQSLPSNPSPPPPLPLASPLLSGPFLCLSSRLYLPLLSSPPRFFGEFHFLGEFTPKK